MQKLSASEVVTTVEAIESRLPAPIQEALGELVGAAREGLLALSVGVGLGVVHELMALEVDEVVGPKGKHNPDRTAKRHGHEDGSMTLGGRRVAVRRPRVRTADDEHELPMQSATGTSPTATRSPGRCWTGCSPAYRPAGLLRSASPSVMTSSGPRRRRHGRRCRRCSSSAPAPRWGS